MLKLSDEAIGALMLALQRSLLEQSDIVPTLKNFDLKIGDEGELFVMNPPIVKIGVEEEDEEGLETVGSD
jgi:hypothetical protein